MYRTSIYSINRIILRKSPSESYFKITSILNSPFSSTSSSLQTLTSSQSKPITTPLFHFLPQTQNPNNLVNLICENIKQNNSNLNLLQNDIKDLLPYLGTDEISRVLLRCQSDSSAALAFFNWVKNELGVSPTTRNYCFAVHILTWNKNFSQAMKLLCELIEINKQASPCEDLFKTLISCTDDCNWDPVVLDMLIKAYVRAHMISHGLKSFKKMINVGFAPNVITVNYLLNGLSKSDCFQRCWDVYQEMERIGIHPNSFTFNILTHALCKDGDIDKVNQFLEKMEEEGFEPDIVTYNTLISSYCKKGNLEKAFYLYKIMYYRGVTPDLISYTSLMNGLCKEGKVIEGHQIFHQMIHQGLSPDIVSYNTLICAYSKVGKMQESRFLFHDMIINKILPNNFTIRTLIEGYAKEGRLILALNFLIEIEKYGVLISKGIYDYLITSLCNENKPFAAKSLFERIIPNGYEPKIEILNNLIESLCKFDSVADALVLKGEMISRHLKPNSPAAYKDLIRCLCRLSRTKEGEDLLKEMIELGLIPDSEICYILVNGYCKQLDVDKAQSVLRFFAEKFHVFDVESYNALIKVLCEKGDAVKAIEVQDKMMKLGYTPNSLTCNFIMLGLQKSMEMKKQSHHLEV